MGVKRGGYMFLKKGGISRRGMKKERWGGGDLYTFPHYDLDKLDTLQLVHRAVGLALSGSLELQSLHKI